MNKTRGVESGLFVKILTRFSDFVTILGRSLLPVPDTTLSRWAFLGIGCIITCVRIEREREREKERRTRMERVKNLHRTSFRVSFSSIIGEASRSVGWWPVGGGFKDFTEMVRKNQGSQEGFLYLSLVRHDEWEKTSIREMRGLLDRNKNGSYLSDIDPCLGDYRHRQRFAPPPFPFVFVIS